jgi:hypothetical protein
MGWIRLRRWRRRSSRWIWLVGCGVSRGGSDEEEWRLLCYYFLSTFSCCEVKGNDVEKHE